MNPADFHFPEDVREIFAEIDLMALKQTPNNAENV